MEKQIENKGSIQKEKPDFSQKVNLKPDSAKKEPKATKKNISEEQYLRVLAEFMNYKERVKQQLKMGASLANKRLVKLMLPILHEMELAIAQTETRGNAEGIAFIHKKLLQLLTNEGLKPIVVAEGDDFNPDYHEAISSVVEGKEKQGKIAQIMSKGYTFNDEVIAFTKVVVNT